MIRGGTYLAAAALGSLAAHLWLPLIDEDPLRSTLVLLPLILAALFYIGRWARDHGGTPTTRRIIAAELTLLAGLVLLALSRHQLGLARSDSSLDGAVLAGFALLLAHRVARLLLTLRPSLGTALPSHPPWPFLVLPFVVYLAILPWSAGHHAPDGDEPHYLLLTHSLAYDFDSDLADNYEHGDSLSFVNRKLEPQLGDPVGRNGELYSRHNMLLPLVLAPFYRLFGVAGALVFMALMTATVAWLTLALASEYVPDRPSEALMSYSILAFSAPLLLYSYQIWVEVPAALLTLVVLLQVYRIGQRSDDSGVTAASGWLSLSISLLLLPLLKIRFLVIAVSLVLLISLRSDRIVRKRILVLIAGLAVIGPGILLFNQSVFQNPLKYHDIDGLRPYVLPVINYIQGLTGLAFDCGFGLVSYGPLWLLLLPAGTLLVARRSRLITDFAIVFVPYLALLAPRGEWFGAWSPPFRYGIVLLPMLALWLVPLLERGTRVGARALLTCLAVLTVALTLLWIVEPGWTYNLAHGRSHLLDLLAERMNVDVARFFASSTRVRAATWIWPPVVFVVTTLAWWIPRQRVSRPIVLGLIGALLAPAAVLWAAHNKPTRVIEFEDSWISHESGTVWPEIWVIYRPRFRGGWLLLPTDTISVPLIARGDRLNLRLSFRNRWDLPVSGILVLADGTGNLLAREELPGVDNWETVELTDLPTPVDDILTLTLLAPEGAPDTHLILDRAQVYWSR